MIEVKHPPKKEYLGLCKNCGKQGIFYEGDPLQKCLFCNKPALINEGEVVMKTEGEAKTQSEIPPRPLGLRGAKKYYKENKEAILKDLAALGEKEMLRRWGIRYSTWRTSTGGKAKGLSVRWGVPQPEPPKKQPEQAAKVIKGNGLPDFPAFSECRTAEVQIKWLELLAKLRQE